MTFTDDWAKWHHEHEARRADKHGFLAITSINWLSATPERFPDVPGIWSSDPIEGVVVNLDPGESLTLDGELITGRHSFGVLAERSSIFPAFGDAVVEVAKRGGFDIIRPRHPDAPVLAGYHGTDAYPASSAWAVPARFEAFDTPIPTTVGAVVDSIKHVYESPGTVSFTVNGQPLTLTAFNGHTPGALFILFTDETSGVTTYGANRSLAVDAPAADGSVVLDFNRAVNLPCAYTPFATCPLPPDGNHLPVAVEAGELAPHS